MHLEGIPYVAEAMLWVIALALVGNVVGEVIRRMSRRRS